MSNKKLLESFIKSKGETNSFEVNDLLKKSTDHERYCYLAFIIDNYDGLDMTDNRSIFLQGYKTELRHILDVMTSINGESNDPFNIDNLSDGEVSTAGLEGNNNDIEEGK